MELKINDKVIFNEKTHPLFSGLGYLLNKEYAISNIYKDEYNNIFYMLEIENIGSEYVYSTYVSISPTYHRNKIIDEILI